MERDVWYSEPGSKDGCGSGEAGERSHSGVWGTRKDSFRPGTEEDQAQLFEEMCLLFNMDQNLSIQLKVAEWLSELTILCKTF